MTGHGVGRADTRGARITVEMRSVNQRFLDVRVSAPREYGAWEADIRERVRGQVERGRVELTVHRQAIAGRRQFTLVVREDLARAYVRSATRLARQAGLGGEVTIGDLLRVPDLFDVQEATASPADERRALDRALAQALRTFDASRRREGQALARDMRRRTAMLDRFVGAIEKRAPVVVQRLHARLQERLARLLADTDVPRERIAQEAAIHVDKADVTEELVRLRTHVRRLGEALRATTPVGKQVEFLLQEVHRELNTTGVKAADADIAARVLAAKAEVEKLREQVQNIE